MCILEKLPPWGIGAPQFMVYLKRCGIVVEDSKWICDHTDDVVYDNAEYAKSPYIVQWATEWFL